MICSQGTAPSGLWNKFELELIASVFSKVTINQTLKTLCRQIGGFLIYQFL